MELCRICHAYVDGGITNKRTRYYEIIEWITQTKLTFESVDKFKREMISKLHNLLHEEINETEYEEKKEVETVQIKEAESNEIKDLVSFEQKLKSPEHKSKTSHIVEKKSSKHIEEALENEDQQKPPELMFKNRSSHRDWQKTSDHDQYVSDNDEILSIEEEIKLVWSDESSDIPHMEVGDDPFLKNNDGSVQSKDKFESSFSNKLTKPDLLDSFLLHTKKYRPPEEKAKSSYENVTEDAVTTNLEKNHILNYLELIEQREGIEIEPQEKNLKSLEPLKFHKPYFQFKEGRKATEENPQEKKIKTDAVNKLTFEGVEKKKRETFSKQYNLSHDEIKESQTEEKNEMKTVQITETESEEIKDLGPPEQKSKLPDQESKLPHALQKKTSEHSQEKSLESEEILSIEEDFKLVWSPEIESDESPYIPNMEIGDERLIENHNSSELLNRSESSGNKRTKTPDHIEDEILPIEEDIKLVWSPESEIDESLNIPNMEIGHELFIENNNSFKQANHKSESSLSNKLTKPPDSIDSFLLCAKQYRPPEKRKKSLNENVTKDAVTANLEKNYRPCYVLIERIAIEQHSTNSECRIRKAEGAEKRKIESISKLKNLSHEEIKQAETEEINEVETEKLKEAESEKIKDLPDPKIYQIQNLQVIEHCEHLQGVEHIPVIEPEQTPRQIELGCQDDVFLEDCNVDVKIESVDEELLGFFEENYCITRSTN